MISDAFNDKNIPTPARPVAESVTTTSPEQPSPNGSGPAS